MFKKGEGEIMSIHANSVILKLVLYHDAAQKWKQLGNVRFFVYEVIGAFTPPLPEDAFARLDQSDDDVGLSMSPEEIEAQEMVTGLCLLYHGNLSLEHLVRNRTNDYLKMTRKLIRKGQKNGKESPDSVKCDIQSNTPVICNLEPHVCRGGTKWDVPITQIHISSDVTRVLPMDSRWYKAVSQLTTNSSDTNYFWKRHNVLRVQRMRRSVFELFNKNLDRQANKNKHYLIDDGVLVSLRIRKVESEVGHLKKSVDTKLKALHVKIDELLNINASDESQSTSSIDRTPSLIPSFKGSSSYSGYMLNGPEDIKSGVRIGGRHLLPLPTILRENLAVQPTTT